MPEVPRIHGIVIKVEIIVRTDLLGTPVAIAGYNIFD